MSVVIAKAGARTAVGLDARQTGFLLRAGFPAMGEGPLANHDGEPITMALIPTLGPLTGALRLSALAKPPLEEAAGPFRDDASVEVYVALDEGLPEASVAVAVVQAMIKRTLPKAASVTVEPRGEGALGAVLPVMMEGLTTRRIDVAIAGGVHSDYDPKLITALEASGRLFARDNLDARIPGEAAAFLVLMREADALERGLSPRARITAVGAGMERARPDNDEPAYEAFGMTAAVKQATMPLRQGGRKAGWFLTDLTTEMRRLYEWESVFTRSQRALDAPYVIESPAQRIGYLGAAALPLLLTMAATAWEHGYGPSKTALAVAGADGGERAAVVVEEMVRS